MTLYVVQCTQITKINAGYHPVTFVLGVYSSRNLAQVACATHAIKTDSGAMVRWEASIQQGYTPNNTYSIYVRSIDADCVEVA